MTLWALLSDVHGNLAALERAVALCRERGAERFAVLGDSLGQGDPDGVVRLVRSLAEISVVGNRDLDWAGRVGPEARDYVLSLPRRAETERFVAVHGDPRLDRQLNVGDLRRGAPKAYQALLASGRRIACFGHTHHARVWRKSGAEGALELLEGTRLALDLADPATVYLVNVGTVGLPFPGKGPASCALLQDAAAEAWVEIVPLT